MITLFCFTNIESYNFDLNTLVIGSIIYAIKYAFEYLDKYTFN